jgi:hypothetical protein
MNNQFAEPIKVRVVLKKSQYTGTMNSWICTLNNEQRNVMTQVVEWSALSVEDALHSINEDEIESFEITGRYYN